MKKRSWLIAFLAAALFLNGCLPGGNAASRTEASQSQSAEEPSGGAGQADRAEADDKAGKENGTAEKNGSGTERPKTAVTLTPKARDADAAGPESAPAAKPETETEPTIQPAAEPSLEPAAEPTSEPVPTLTPEPVPEMPQEPQPVFLDPAWEFAGFSEINTGSAMLYYAQNNRKGIVIGVNAGHGTAGGESVRTYCHPDQTPKVTGGSTAEGAITATAVSSGTTMLDGTPEAAVNLQAARCLKDVLLAEGYDVLMMRDGEDVQLDNVARTVICNNMADCHVAIHYDGDGLSYDKGCYYMSVPDALKGMYPVSEIWPEHNRLGDCLIAGLSGQGCVIFEGGSMQMDLTQTSYSRVPSVVIELGNAASVYDEETLYRLAAGLAEGIRVYFQK